MDSLPTIARRAIERRHELLARLHGEGTDCYRLLHGVAEGAPGLTLDRYGPLLLAQTFREPLSAAAVDQLRDTVGEATGLNLEVVHNHRGAEGDPESPHQPTATALQEHVCHEAGVAFVVQARHRGQDPWLFLDLRAGRHAVRTIAAGKRVLNLFAYTCGVGVAAAIGGAASVHNVDFADSALEVGRRNAARNGIAEDRFTTLRADCIPVLRQLAGLPVQRRGKHLSFARVEAQKFDLIVLDPPRFARSPFGTVDVVRDYPSLWKPCLLALAEGGTVLATNHVPTVAAEDWHGVLRRSAEKAGRPLRSLQPIDVEPDFPSFDGQPPLKVVLATI